MVEAVGIAPTYGNPKLLLAYSQLTAPMEQEFE